MHNNTVKNLFFSFLVMGSMLSLYSNSWLGVWMGLEINMLSIIPMLPSPKNSAMNETSIKYFIVQALASTMLLMTILFIQMNKMFFWENNMIMVMMISSSLLIKIGAAPFHMWFPEVMSKTNWLNFSILMTWQKLAPMSVMSYCLKMNMIMMMITIMSVIVGAIGGLNQTSLWKLMAYSSISHIGWMIGSMIMSETMWEFYFIIYSILSLTIVMMFNRSNVYWLNQIMSSMNNNKNMKFCIFLSLLSLGSLPPFLGFMPKWIIIQYIVSMDLMFLVSTIIIITTITLYYYMRVSFSAFMFMNTENKSIFMKSNLSTTNNYMMYFAVMSNMGQSLIPMMMFMI